MEKYGVIESGKTKKEETDTNEKEAKEKDLSDHVTKRFAEILENKLKVNKINGKKTS